MAEFLAEEVECGLVIGGFVDVEDERFCVNALGAQFFHGALTLFAVARANDNMDAVRFEVKRRLKTKTPVTAGDECDALCHGD
jgi:hypothetical protein